MPLVQQEPGGQVGVRGPGGQNRQAGRRPPRIIPSRDLLSQDPRDPGGVRAMADRPELARAFWPVDGARPGSVGEVRAVGERGGPVPQGEVHGAVVDGLPACRHQNGTKIQLWKCISGDLNQLWYQGPPTGDGPIPGPIYPDRTYGKNAVVIDGGSGKNGTRLEIEPWKQSGGQLFNFES
jgi:hypothetical protein